MNFLIECAYRPMPVPLFQHAVTEPTAGFAPAWTSLRGRRLSTSSHVGNDRLIDRKAPAQGVEPCRAVLEAACSPGSTPV